jgi:hypothetical protein
MNKLFILPVLGIALSGCGVNETFRALEDNRAAVEYSTYVISENAEAVEQANYAIENNRRHLEAINATLEKAAKQ